MVGSTPPEIRNPAAFVTQQVVAFDDGAGQARTVAAAAPLPVELRQPAAQAPLAGTAGVGTTLVGPYTGTVGRPLWLSLAGPFTGTVRVLRSSDGGATMQSLTIGGQPWGIFTAPCNEPVAEETVAGVTHYLSCEIASGAAAYRIAQ